MYNTYCFEGVIPFHKFHKSQLICENVERMRCMYSTHENTFLKIICKN